MLTTVVRYASLAQFRLFVCSKLFGNIGWRTHASHISCSSYTPSSSVPVGFVVTPSSFRNPDGAGAECVCTDSWHYFVHVNICLMSESRNLVHRVQKRSNNQRENTYTNWRTCAGASTNFLSPSSQRHIVTMSESMLHILACVNIMRHEEVGGGAPETTTNVSKDTQAHKLWHISACFSARMRADCMRKCCLSVCTMYLLRMCFLHARALP